RRRTAAWCAGHAPRPARASPSRRRAPGPRRPSTRRAAGPSSWCRRPPRRPTRPSPGRTAASSKAPRTAAGLAARPPAGHRGRAASASVVLAAPGRRTAPAVERLVPAAARALATVPFASSATVLLGYERGRVRHPLDGYGLVVPAGEGLRTSALSFVSTKLPY